MFSQLLTPCALASLLVGRVIRPGNWAVDATAGKGGDTVQLARLVGPSGRVIAFDIQAAALQQTAERLAAENLRDRVDLVAAGHETLTAHVSRPVAAVMFNLGYLPGGDHAITTRTATTLAALKQATDCLSSGGILTVVTYCGHPGGAEEQAAVSEFAAGLDRRSFAVLVCRFPKVDPAAPELVVIEKEIGGRGRSLPPGREFMQ